MDLSTWKWKPLLPLLLLASLFFYDEWVSIPSCTLVPNHKYEVVAVQSPDEDLKVMMVANLLLFGSEASFFNQYFRDYYMSKFFRKSFYSLRPDMLLVLGDISAKGFELTQSKWVSVLHQFHGVLGPFLELPFHVVLGDRDVGECSKLDGRSVHRISRGFPGLDSSGCGAFEISNVSFVSLNAVSLLCGKNKLRFSVERAIESESIDIQLETQAASTVIDDSGNFGESPDSFRWRDNVMSSGSGPVLLLHFPSHRTANDSCKGFEKGPSSFQQWSNAPENRDSMSSGP